LLSHTSLRIEAKKHLYVFSFKYITIKFIESGLKYVNNYLWAIREDKQFHSDWVCLTFIIYKLLITFPINKLLIGTKIHTLTDDFAFNQSMSVLVSTYD